MRGRIRNSRTGKRHSKFRLFGNKTLRRWQAPSPNDSPKAVKLLFSFHSCRREFLHSLMFVLQWQVHPGQCRAPSPPSYIPLHQHWPKHNVESESKHIFSFLALDSLRRKSYFNVSVISEILENQLTILIVSLRPKIIAWFFTFFGKY